MFHNRTTHIEIVCYFVGANLKEGLITLHHVGTIHQPTDILTKAFTGVKHSTVFPSWQ